VGIATAIFPSFSHVPPGCATAGAPLWIRDEALLSVVLLIRSRVYELGTAVDTG
jgi:hypothetical protein